MAAHAREIVSAGSARARLGAELRGRRTARGLSLARLGAEVHCSSDLLRRVEATERFPSLELTRACDSILAADGAVVELWPAADAERRRGGTPARRSRSSAPPARFAPEASEQLISDWSNTTGALAPPPPQSGRLRVQDQELNVAWDTLAMFRQLDHVHGAGVFAAQLRVYIDSELVALLSRPAAGRETEVDRARLAAGFFELAGYQAVDSGRPGWAQVFYQRAIEQVAASKDRAYGAYLVAVNLGHLALHCEKPEAALRWVEAARSASRTAASPATRAAIAAVQARAHVRLGEERRATVMMLKAEALLAKVDAENEPSWIRYFNHAYLSDEMAHCLHDLGHASATRDLVADALDGVGHDRVRRLAIDMALLASSWVRSGDLDRACHIGMEAARYAARTSSGRCVERIAGLLAELNPYRDSPGVTNLREFVRDALPAADCAASVIAPRP